MTLVLQLIAFNAFVLVLLAIDLGVFHRKAHAVGVREAAIWSAIWISLSLLFAAGIFVLDGSEKGVEFLTAYTIEKSLSVDNIFVFVVIFSYFAVPAQFQHRVLFYGILGALIMRGLFIGAGLGLLELFHWVIFPFGAFLILTGIKLAVQNDSEVDPERNFLLRLACRFFPITPDYVGQRFVIRKAGTLFVTPLLLVLIVIETTDLVFAVDSVPAIIAVSRDPFIVYSSNVMAILGLRALYFLLAGVVGQFRYLRFGLAMILSFVGVKMILSETYEIPTFAALGVVGAILAVTIIASLIVSRREQRAGPGLATTGHSASTTKDESPPAS